MVDPINDDLIMRKVIQHSVLSSNNEKKESAHKTAKESFRGKQVTWQVGQLGKEAQFFLDKTRNMG